VSTVRTLRAELSKLARRPAAYVLLAAAVVLSQVFGYLIPYLAYRSGSSGQDGGSPAQQLASTLPDQVVVNTIAATPVFAGALALVFGALVTGSEFGWGTVKTLLLQGPRRVSVLLGQLLAVAVSVAVGVLAMFASCVASSAAVALVEEQPLQWPPLGELASGLGAGMAVMVMWALLGAALGFLLRGTALAIGLGVVWVLGVENLVSAVAGSVFSALEPLRDVLPGVSAGSLVGWALPGDPALAPGVSSTVEPARAAVTVLAYVLVAVLATVLAGQRRDVA
jgi:ABC-type transport system involved in multi-copper enzyme maturation permease subunit